MNEQNLKPYSADDPESVKRARENGRKGGQQFGKNCAERKKQQNTIRSILKEWAKAPIKESKLKKQAEKYGLNTDEGRSLLTLALIQGTLKGNPKYMEKVLALLGEDNAAQTEVQDDGFMDALRGSTVKDWEDTDV